MIALHIRRFYHHHHPAAATSDRGGSPTGGNVWADARPDVALAAAFVGVCLLPPVLVACESHLSLSYLDIFLCRYANPVRAGQHALLGAYAHWMMIGARTPMSCPIPACRPLQRAAACRSQDGLRGGRYAAAEAWAWMVTVVAVVGGGWWVLGA